MRATAEEPAGPGAADTNAGADTGVVVLMSPDARARSREDDGQVDLPGSASAEDDETATLTHHSETKAPNGKPLSDQQARQVEQLRARDTEVRAHEAAHLAASGGLGGSPTFDYALGPDGKRYAVGGEVSVDTSPGRTPEETIARARTLRAAATAPADPSAQDMSVAAAAARMEAQAQSALQEQRSAAAKPAPTTTEGDGAAPVDRTSDKAMSSPDSAPADPELTLMTLTREQASSRDGFSHSHTPDCGFCQRGARAYGTAQAA
ncbi:MAG: putative metalloprotease CJM1_0395 family protein [Bacteroidota bacterium]